MSVDIVTLTDPLVVCLLIPVEFSAILMTGTDCTVPDTSLDHFFLPFLSHAPLILLHPSCPRYLVVITDIEHRVDIDN